MWIARSFRRLSRAEGWTTTEWQTWQADAIFNGTGREAVDGHSISVNVGEDALVGVVRKLNLTNL
jgi:hypothetical protein